MIKKIDNNTPINRVKQTSKNIDGVKSKGRVENTTKTGEVDSVKSVNSIENINAATRVRRSTRVMSGLEREHLFKLVEEEAKKLFGEQEDSSKRKAITDAVKMTIDASIIEE